MAPNFQSSFIPKEPITANVFQRKKTGISGVVAILIFIASLLTSAGGFIYKNQLKNQISGLQVRVVEAEQNIDTGAIDQISQFDKKLSLVKNIISDHQVISNFLNTLSESTVKDVHYTGMNFSKTNDGGLLINLQGRGRSYASLASQGKAFSQNTNFKNVNFSNLALTEEGWVSFDLAIAVNPIMFKYSPIEINYNEIQ